MFRPRVIAGRPVKQGVGIVASRRGPLYSLAKSLSERVGRVGFINPTWTITPQQVRRRYGDHAFGHVDLFTMACCRVDEANPTYSICWS